MSLPKGLFGLRAPIATQSKSADGITTPRAALPPIDVNRWARNGKHPNAILESQLAQGGNAAAMFRGKEVFRAPGKFVTINSGGAGDRARWRWAFHTGPYAQAVYVVAVIGRPSTGTNDCYARLDLVTGGVTTSEQFHYGVNALGAGTTSMEMIHVVKKIVLVSPDVDYTATFFDVDNNIIQSCCIFELASLTQNFGGYLNENFATNGPITDANRQNLATVLRSLWRRACFPIFNWTVDDGTAPVTLSSMTATNVLDQASTTQSPNTPGFTIDLRGRARLSQSTGIPVKLYAYGRMAAGTGTVSLVSSTGVAYGAMTGLTNVAGWTSTTATLPVVADKYDLMVATDGNICTLNAVSMFEYEA